MSIIDSISSDSYLSQQNTGTQLPPVSLYYAIQNMARYGIGNINDIRPIGLKRIDSPSICRCCPISFRCILFYHFNLFDGYFFYPTILINEKKLSAVFSRHKYKICRCALFVILKRDLTLLNNSYVAEPFKNEQI